MLANASNLQEFMNAYNRRNIEMEQIDQLKVNIGRLKRQQVGLQMGGREMEKQARERLGMHRNGERTIVIKDETNAAETSSPVFDVSKLPPALPPEDKAPVSKTSKHTKVAEKSSRLKKTGVDQ